MAVGGEKKVARVKIWQVGGKVDVDSEKIDREKAALREPNGKVWCRSVASRPVSLKVLNKGIEAGCRHRREAP